MKARYGLKTRLAAAVLVAGLALVPVTAMAGEDDQIPGMSVSLPASGLESLNIIDDVSDVFSVTLNKGDWLYAVMRSQEGRHFVMALHDPSAPAGAPVFNSAIWHSAVIGGNTEQQALRYQAPADGVYHLQVVMAQGSADGNYAVHMTIGRTYTVSKPTVPTTIKRGKWFNIKGTVKPGYLFEGKPVKVQLQKRVSGKWVAKLSHSDAPSSPDEGWLERSNYGARAQLSAGKWRVRASIGDAVQSRRYSAWREFTVK